MIMGAMNDGGGHSAMISNGRLKWKLLVGLLAAVISDTLLQITWKSAVFETPFGSSPLAVMVSFLANPPFVESSLSWRFS